MKRAEAQNSEVPRVAEAQGCLGCDEEVSVEGEEEGLSGRFSDAELRGMALATEGKQNVTCRANHHLSYVFCVSRVLYITLCRGRQK